MLLSRMAIILGDDASLRAAAIALGVRILPLAAASVALASAAGCPAEPVVWGSVGRRRASVHRAAAAVKPVDCTAGEATAAQHAGRRATRTPEAPGCVDAGDARVHLNKYEWPPSTTANRPGAVPPARPHADA